jgi:hypothetical protein
VAKIIDDDQRDPVHQYVTLLCASESLKKVQALDRVFYRKHRDVFDEIEQELKSGISTIKKRFAFDGARQQRKFFGWFESMFQLDVAESVRWGAKT